MQGFLDEQNFKSQDIGVFSNEKKFITVKYDENRQMFVLLVADINEDTKEVGEPKEINAWLFDDTQNAKDAESVGIDFTNSLRKELGIKNTRSVVSNVELPTASKSNEMNITGFTKKMLDFFPALKDEYKAHVSFYGNFLYMNFFGEHLVPLLNNLFQNGTKKQIKKLYDILSDAYVTGDRDTVNIVVALLTAASFNNVQATYMIKDMLAGDQHFLNSYNNFIPAFASNKKLQTALIK